MLSLKGDKLDDVKAVLESLTVTVESINKALSGEQMKGGLPAPESIKPWLQYIGSSLNKIQGSQNEIKGLLVEFSRQVDEAKSSVDSMADRVGRGAGVQTGSSTPQIIQESFAPKIILDIKQKLNEVISQHDKEIGLIMKQNEALATRLEQIDSKLSQLLGPARTGYKGNL